VDVERTYNYLLCRVEYPAEGGYRMEPSPLPPWINLRIVESDSDKKLIVHSRIHVNKEVRVGPIYSNAFSDRDIIKDLSGEISSRFL